MLFLSFVSDNWRKFLFPMAAIAVIVAFLLIPHGQADNGQLVLSDQNPLKEINEEASKEVNDTELLVPAVIMVDVKGAVRHPGVYTMEEGNRIIDAINAAGGYLPDADSRLLNHAMKLTDELLVYVPLVGEELLESEVSLVLQQNPQDKDGLVNINTADESLLMTINGIGLAKASAIINYRDEHGPFSSLESIMDVSGIGQKTFEKLEHQIKVD
ncbi:helix-hairpin-helix domain-containing protein [Sporosarcina sp. Marseille-Q4063]|uniref:helix-hairpin-helix domain-containing protein n=1 Tax=Sporosarcina sp. Marseille-Q4063 TaxID=2810514 RepID=UPI001BB02760|nr:helix-hairpin-helix domain-containing protein [Sporosarcina sp. Marseille-Q4063]QUW22185.1 helix-hairpin-helix domain-containing protein [Sporosarcina sp. Marseille-Q4063]